MSIEINAKDVMKLRNETGLSMMECKRALAEVGGDFEKAKDLLRKTMKGKMDAKMDRAAGEGRIAVSINEASGVASIIEVRCETDFTAKNPQFIETVQKIADAALNQRTGDVPPFPEATKLIDDLRISTGENCSYARGHKFSGATGTTAYGKYVHHDGKTGVLLQAEGSINEDTLRDICMHITAKLPKPLGVTDKDIPADVVERERKFRVEQAMESGKPKEIAEKIVEGGMRKFYEEVALLEQPFIRDETKKIKDVVGPKAKVLAFIRWQVGESV
ncbi:MAG: translation elongation factor Ts [Phycisphaeraceae bacterium]|nr:translation elongation factor Ts [Phycisphaeraceae bacterium]MBX3406173.1 translation elongation factor Ts [Phycisphaeraceae bacterium]